MSGQPRRIEPRRINDRPGRQAGTEHEAVVLAALNRFREAETKLDQAEREYDEAANALADELKSAGWPVMVVTRR